MCRTGRTEKQVREKLIADRWIRQMNFDVEIIYGIGVDRGDGDIVIAISSGFLDTSRDVARKNTRKNESPLSLGCNFYTKHTCLSKQLDDIKTFSFRKLQNFIKILIRQS